MVVETAIELGLVFVLAATPWIELVVVIPAGAAMGLPTLPVTATAFIGNALPVLAIVALFRWWERRRGPVRRRWGPRARRVWRRYGLPGLALLAPVVTGIHMASVMALALGTPRRRTVQWMVASLAGWAAVTGALTALGIEQL
ncbi:small multi-drug export protein [Halorhodospira neutriphila]|uniref:Small multidrug efflux protein - like protein n=1 Tax=Halorhodospira neutriphila TaxID=168379 RepID=A0ABS1E7U9_9GAMM|nr:small multidrug efflux protein - like protein [Halorhodospira neutriphila]